MEKFTQVQYVSTFRDLVDVPYTKGVNAICWNRKLFGDFYEIVNSLACTDNVTVVEPDMLLQLELSEAGKLARELILSDWKLLEEHGAQPTLNVIKHYDRDVDLPFFPTDVYSYHVDRSPVAIDTILCTYYGAASDIIPNAQCEKKVLIPAIRAELLKLYGGSEGEGFEEFLTENFFDLHYQAKPGAQPINLGVGNLWRLAVDQPNSSFLPCVHRAPIENLGEPRLLMIC